MTSIKTAALYLVTYTLIALVMTLLIEGLMAYSLNHPSIIPSPLLETFRSYYRDKDIQVLQLLPQCAEYDKELSYRLKPGKCQHNNREFSHSVSINSLGVRDDEKSITAPEIIILGDSYAMGWGVKKENSFPQLIENATGLTVLNTGIPSYGTVRELRSLKRFDSSNLKYLLIQYCQNDYMENKTFAKERVITDEKSYENLSLRHASSLDYYFGKYTTGLFGSLIKRIQSKFTNSPDPIIAVEKESETNNPDKQEAIAFLAVLDKFKDQLSDKQIILFETNGHAINDNKFISEVESLLNNQPSINLNIKTAHLGNELQNHEHFFILDEHITESGHLYVANELIKIINGEK